MNVQSVRYAPPYTSLSVSPKRPKAGAAMKFPVEQLGVPQMDSHLKSELPAIGENFKVGLVEHIFSDDKLPVVIGQGLTEFLGSRTGGPPTFLMYKKMDQLQAALNSFLNEPIGFRHHSSQLRNRRKLSHIDDTNYDVGHADNEIRELLVELILRIQDLSVHQPEILPEIQL